MKSNVPFQNAIVLLLLIVLPGVVYWSTHQYGFIEHYDDLQYILENRMVQQGLSWEGVGWAFTQSHAANWHPLTWISHQLDCQLYGLQAGGHHFTNLLLHIANTLLLFLLLRRLTGAFWRAALVAALFAVHPLHVESVAWIAERKDVLSTFFFLLTLLAYRGYTVRPGPVPYILALLLFAAGLLSKPMLVTLPFVLLLLDVWPLRRIDPWEPGRWRGLRPLLVEKVPFLVLSLVACVLTLWAQRAWGAVIALESIPVDQRLTNAMVAYGVYLQKMLWPVNLAIFYPHPGQYPFWQVCGAAALLGGLSFLTWWKRRNAPWLLVGWLWYLGTLVPVIGLVQVGNQAYADRYTYIPLIGVFVMLAWTLERITSRARRLPAFVGVLMVGWLVVLSVLARTQVTYWQDTESVFGHAVAVTRDNHIARSVHGVALLGKGRFEEAIEQFTQAHRIRPDAERISVNCGIAYAALGRLDEAIAQYRKAISLKPDSWKAYNNLGLALARKGEPSAAIEAYHQALRIKPSAWEVHSNLGTALRLLQRPAEALDAYTTAISLSPGQSRTYFNRGNTFIELGRYDEALADFGQVLRLYPDHRPARFRAACAHVQKGTLDSAALLVSGVVDRPVETRDVCQVIDSLTRLAEAVNPSAGSRTATGRADPTSSPEQAVDHGARQ